MKIEVIDSDDSHAAALKEIERLWCAEANTADGYELDRLLDLVEAYEEVRWPIDAESAADFVYSG